MTEEEKALFDKLKKEFPKLLFAVSSFLPDGTCMLSPKTFHYLMEALGPLEIAPKERGES